MSKNPEFLIALQGTKNARVQKNYKILLADDDADDRELFAEAVQECGAEIECVPNGAKLMKKLRALESMPDCIFLDLNMPEKGGKECLHEIRRDDKLRNIPVLIYSTSSNKRDIDETYELGANRYVTKPTSFMMLKKTVRELLAMDQKDIQGKPDRSAFVFAVS